MSSSWPARNFSTSAASSSALGRSSDRPERAARRDRVVLPFERLDDLLHLLRRRHLVADLLLGPLGRHRQRLGGEVQPARDADVVDEHPRRLRVLRPRQVVRHVHGEAHRVVARLAQPQLHQADGAAGHVGRGEPGLVALGELAAGAVRGDADRPRVRHRHRYRRHVDHQPHPEPLDELADRGGEPLPLRVRLGPGQQQVLGVGRVGDGHDVQVGRRVGLPVVGVEPQRGRAGPVVDELVDVEPRQRARLPPLAHRPDGQPGGVARVDETRPAPRSAPAPPPGPPPPSARTARRAPASCTSVPS